MPIEPNFYIPLCAGGSHFARLQSIEVGKKYIVACANGGNMGDHVARRSHLHSAGHTEGAHQISR